MTLTVRLRAHHFLCIHGFRGKGYSPAYVENFWSVLKTLKEGVDVKIVLVNGTDDICKPCPHNQEQTCDQEEKIQAIDSAYQKSLDLKKDASLTWKEAVNLVAQCVSVEDFERHCQPCQWKPLGYCKEALLKLKKDAGLLVWGGLLILGIQFFEGACVAADVVDPAETAVVEPPVVELPVATPLPSPAPSGILSIEEVESYLTTVERKDFAPLKNAVALISKKKFAEALSKLKGLEKNAEVDDYYSYLAGTAELGLQRLYFSDHKYVLAKAAGARAKKHFESIQTKNIYGSLFKQSAIALGESEVEMGAILARTKQISQATGLFESGFQRLHQNGLLVLVPQQSLMAYGLLCVNSPTLLCQNWLNRMGKYFDKTGGDQKAIKKILALRTVPPVVKNTAPVAYTVAMDIQAFQKGYSQYLAGDLENAYITWRDLLVNYPKTNIKLRTKFWMARAAQKTNHDLQAQTLFKEIIRDAPFAYYALLSSWFGKIDLSRMVSIELPQVNRIPVSISPQDIVRLRRAEELIASGIPELARIELKEFRLTEAFPTEFLVYLAFLNNKVQNHRVVFQIYGELSNRGYTGLFSSFGEILVFPRTYMDKIRTVAKEVNVNPLIVISIIKQESAFDAEALSSANAYGLMQLIRPTARDMDPNVTIADLLEPQKNIGLGAKYIGGLLKRNKGNLIQSLAGYNAGPHNADRWAREISSALPPEEYIELIGFKETRDYVQSILRNIYWYHKLMKREEITGLEDLIHAERLPAI